MDFESLNAIEWTEDSTHPLETAKDNAPKEGPPSRASSPFEAGQPSGYGLLLKAGPPPRAGLPPRVGLPSRAGPPYKTAPLKSSTTFRKWPKPPKTAAPARVAAPARRFVARKLRQTPVQVHGSYVKESDRFALNKDNAAKDAWRQRRQPDGNYTLPPYMVQLYNSLDRGSRTGVNQTKLTTLKFALEQIGLQTGAFIEIPARTSDRDLRIWGNIDQVRAAKQKIDTWVKVNKPPRKDWAKVYTISEKKKRLLDKKMEEEAFEQSWRRNPKQGEFFEHRGIYIWPKSGFPPTELLGRNLEAFDAIRMKNHCYILFQPEKNWILVLSGRREAIMNALNRIHATLREMIARSKPPTKIYMVEPPNTNSTLREIELVPYQNFINGWKEDGTDGTVIPNVVPVMTGPPITAEDRNTWAVLKPNIGRSNEGCFRKVVGIILNRMRWYRAHIRMRVKFGVLSLRSYRMPGKTNHTLDGFFWMIRNPQTAGDVIGEIEEHNGGASLISRCREAVDILEPVDAVTQSLADVEAEFSASFELGLIGRSGAVRLDVGFAKNHIGQYELSSSRWLRMESGNTAQDMASDLRKERVPMSLCTLNLDRNTAWELEISCRNVIPEGRVSPAMRAFVDTVKLEVPKTKGGEVGNIATPSLSTSQNDLRVEAYTVNTHYRYLLKRSTYILEITRSQKFERARGVQMENAGTTWHASMYNVEWDTHLDQQATLGIGEIGQWDAGVRAFFPGEYVDGKDAPADGVNHFYEMVRVASSLVERKTT